MILVQVPMWRPWYILDHELGFREGDDFVGVSIIMESCMEDAISHFPPPGDGVIVAYHDPVVLDHDSLIVGALPITHQLLLDRSIIGASRRGDQRRRQESHQSVGQFHFHAGRICDDIGLKSRGKGKNRRRQSLRSFEM